MSMQESPVVLISPKTHIKVAVIYYSQKGSTKRIAENVFQGAKKVDNVSVELFTADEAITNIDQLENFDAFIFGCPTYFGAVPSGLKKFFEATMLIFVRRGWADKIASAFTNSASVAGDKAGCLQEMMIFTTQHGMTYVPLGIPSHNNKVQRDETLLNRSGFFSGLAVQSYVDGNESNQIAEADLKSATYFGERVTRIFSRYYA